MSLSTLGLALTVFACRDLTAPLFGSARNPNNLLNPSGTVVVSPGNLHGWTLYNDQTDTACTDGTACLFVQGPGTPPAGTGSAELATPLASDGKALVLADYKGVRFDSITDLHYATYRQTADVGNNLAIALQFNVDYDLTDQSTGYQGRIVFEPYQGVGGNVPQNSWQTWDAKAGKWWGTKASVPVNGTLIANSCVQATPCTWTQVLGAFPNIGVHRSYGAVVLKAGSGWAGFRGNVDMLVIGVGGVTTTYDFEPYFPVPAAAPDSIPIAVWDSLTAPENVLSSPPGIAGRVIRNLVYVAFQPSTTLAERRAAIASIAGEVVGGWKSGDPEHVYAVRIPYVLTAGDSASGPLLRAIATLEANPAVEMAIYSSLTLPTAKYRRPMDGAGFTSWPVSPDSARGDNWSLVAIDAPMAWGCNTGSGSGNVPPSIAVVDEGFHPHTDLTANLGATQEFANPTVDTSDTSDHGLHVAGVLAAVGNNHMGATGVLWDAKVNLFYINKNANRGHIPDLRSQLDVIHQAVVSGARVINISFGLTPLTGSTDELRNARNFAKAFHREVLAAIRRHDGLPIPLFIISSGNEGFDAKFSGYGTVAEYADTRRYVMVVGGTELLSTGRQVLGVTGPKSNSGVLIDVVAPGWNITTLGPKNSVARAGSGTSLAAPLVSGVAGMLFSFDDRLTADSVRSLIRAGADSGHRKVSDRLAPTDSLRILNAYQSLKLAAQRPGAPLCGNRIYVKGADVVAQKGAGVEVLGAAPSRVLFINAKHGGRRVEAYGGYGSTDVAFTYAAGSWTTSQYTWPPSAPDDGGAYNGGQGFTHGGDTLEAVTDAQDRLSLSVYDTVTWAQHQIGTGSALPALSNSWSQDCDFETYDAGTETWNCGTHWYDRGGATYRSIVSAVSPQDAASIVAIGFTTIGEVGEPAQYYRCDNPTDPGTPLHCRDTRHYLETVDSLQLYRIDATTGSATYLATRQGAAPTGMSISEDARELLLSYREVPTGYGSATKTLGPNSWDSTTDPVTAYCVTAGIPIVSGGQAMSLGTSTQVARVTGDDCPTRGRTFTSPTFAPMRSPVAGLRLRP